MTLGTPALLASATPVSSASITSSSFTPTAGALVIVASFNTGQASANGQGTISSTHSPALSWTAITVSGGGNTTGGVRGWWAIAPGSPGAGTVTVTSSGTPTIQDVAVIEMTGTDTSTPITGYAATTGTSATTLSVNVAVTPTTADRKVGLVINRNKSTAPTVGSGYTSLDSAATSSPSASYLIEYKDNDTGLAVDAGNLGTVWSSIIGFVVNVAAGSQTYQVTGTVAATSAAVGAVTSTQGISATAAATSTVVGAPTSTQGITGTVAATSAAVGNATRVQTGMAGTVAAVSGVSGSVEITTGATTYQVTGTVAATSSVAGALNSKQYIVGTAAATSTTAGDIVRKQMLTGTSVATSAQIGSISRVRPMAGAVACTSSLSGDVSVITAPPTTDGFWGIRL